MGSARRACRNPSTVSCLVSAQRNCFPGDAYQGFFQNFLGGGLEASSPLCLEAKLKPRESLAGLGCPAGSWSRWDGGPSGKVASPSEEGH